MKKLILSVGAVFMLSLGVHAQRHHSNPVTTSIKVGANLSNVSGQAQEIRPLFHIAGGVEFPLSYYKQFAVQLELMYSAQGYKGKEYEQVTFEGEDFGSEKLEDAKLDYLYIPLTLKYYLGDNFAIEAGGQIGYLMNASGGFDIHKANVYRDRLSEAQNNLDQALFEAGYRSKDYKDYYETMDYGLVFGINAQMNNGIYLNFRYYLGMQDIYKKDNHLSPLVHWEKPQEMPVEEYQFYMAEIDYINEQLSFDPVKNSVIQISVGYRF
ncbi:MAG TPA: porin family protein [Flavobacterium sp.]|nr:porin family protein [Flavobacterium sp.]